MNENAKLVAGSGPKPTASSNQFTVKVGDNYHPYSEDDTYTKGVYPDYETAVAVAKQVVLESLLHILKYSPALKGAKLYEHYMAGGADSYIVGPVPQGPRFSAWDYAKHLCETLGARNGAS